MLICILTKNVITSCSVTMMLFLHLEVKPLMTLTTVLYLSCALISGHLAMMLMELSIVIGSKHITLNATGGGFLTASKQFRHGATSKSRSNTASNSTKHKSPHL